MRLGFIAEMQESVGPRVTGQRIASLIRQGKIPYEMINFRGLFEALVGHVSDFDGDKQAVSEAVASSAFPTITGATMVAGFVDAYEREPMIWRNFFRVVQSNRKVENFPEFTEPGQPEEVLELMPYTETGFAENQVLQVTNHKYGKLLDLSWEAIRFDYTGQVMDRAQELGVQARLFEEEKHSLAIQDSATNIYNGSAIYTTGLGTRPASYGAIAQATLNAAEAGLRAQTDLNGKPIRASLRHIIAGRTAIQAADYEVMSPADPTVASGQHSGRANRWANRVQTWYDPFFTASHWICGDPAMDFRHTDVQPLQVLDRNTSQSEDWWKRDVLVQMKVWMMFGVGAINYRHVWKGQG